MNVSVAMAVYNGEKYLRDQMDSIICQLTEDDELIVSCNPSDDRSLDVLTEYENRYSFVHVFRFEKKGIIANFENAVKKCRKEIIFLADQDDVWMENKVSSIKEVFEKEQALLVMHNCRYTDAHLHPSDKDLFSVRNVHPNRFYNWIKNGYQGSCMAFRKELKELILPFPKNVAMHDQWIGILAEKAGNVIMMPRILMYYRRHDEAISGNRLPLATKAKYMHVLEKKYIQRLRERKDVVQSLHEQFPKNLSERSGK